MSVNFDRTFGVVRGGSPNSGHPATAAATAAPPQIQVVPNQVEIRRHFKYLSSIMQGNGVAQLETFHKSCMMGRYWALHR